MCLAVPVRVVELLADELAEVEVGGVRSRVSLALIDTVAVGDYLIAHAGFAIARLDVQQAEESLALFQEMAAKSGLVADALPAKLS